MTQELAIQRDVAAVEQLQRFAVARRRTPTGPSQQVAVVGMHRLAEFEHHVLGDVDQQADRAHAAAAQAFGHPHRRRAPAHRRLR